MYASRTGRARSSNAWLANWGFDTSIRRFLWPGEPIAELRPEDLAALPKDLRAGLREALIALDVERISAAIGRVSQESAPLGSALALYASRYAYTAMLDAIKLDMG